MLDQTVQDGAIYFSKEFTGLRLFIGNNNKAIVIDN